MIRQFFQRLGYGFRNFMAGRYGTDKLNMVILSAGLVICLISPFVNSVKVQLLLTAVSYGLMIWALFRGFSRNTYKRYQENRKFLQFFERLKDREHRYFRCPRCRQTVRVPRGRGQINIRCPKCGEQFRKRS